jgi:hypothetical protein
MKSYKDIRSELADTAGPTDGVPGPCSVCRAQTPHETLCNFGSMCGRCYAAYCRDAFSGDDGPPKLDRGSMTPAAYCYARLSTHFVRTGRKLTGSQRDMLEACRPVDA